MNEKKLLDDLVKVYGQYLQSDIRHKSENADMVVRTLSAIDKMEKNIKDDVASSDVLVMQANNALFDLTRMLNPSGSALKNLGDCAVTGKDIDYEILADDLTLNKTTVLGQFANAYRSGQNQIEIVPNNDLGSTDYSIFDVHNAKIILRIYHNTNPREARLEKESLSAVKLS